MPRYALLLIENDSTKPLEDECKSLSAILSDSNTKQGSYEFLGEGALLFDLKISLIHFCNATSSAYKLGHSVRVLFLENIDAFFNQKIESKSGEVSDAIQKAHDAFADIVE
jgi:hypothetical protein